MKDIENKFIETLKELIDRYKKAGINCNFIQVEINGNPVRNEFKVNVKHNI